MVKSEPVDFGKFGSETAFPGQLATSWGAALVEPPDVGALRRRAAQRLVRLGSVAPPHSGVPTRAVDYFCLEEVTDSDVVRRMGLRSNQDRQRLMVVRDGRGAVHLIERGAVRPMVRRPGDLEGKIKVTRADTGSSFMLYLDVNKDELEQRRWRHTLAYIRYGETQDFSPREGSRRAGGIPAERANVRIRPVWFQVPQIPLGEGRVCWLKGRGQAHYAPVLDEGIVIPDNFLYSSPPESMAVPRAFAAIANLSWTHLMAEVFGRRGGGDGVLHTYIRELSMMPIISPASLTKTEAEDLVAAFDEVAKRPVMPISSELRQRDRQAFDLIAMKLLFGNDANDAARTVERALRDLVEERMQRAASGREQVRRSTRRRSFDPAPIAARILLDIGMPPHPLTVARAGGSAQAVITIEIPDHPPKKPRVGDTLFDQGDVLIDGVRVKTPSDSHALAVAAVLTVEARFAGPLELPREADSVAALYSSWLVEWEAWLEQVNTFLTSVFPRQQYQTQRRSVVKELEARTGVAEGAIEL